MSNQLTTWLLRSGFQAITVGQRPVKETDSRLAHSASILDTLEEEIRQQGFVGSADVPKLVFLSLYTRHFDRPVSMLIKGSSGSGKSYALKAGLQFIPKDAFELYAGMSAKAIVYNKKLNLKHKHLILQEAAGFNEGLGNTLLRQLLSEGEIRYSTVQTTRDGMSGEDLPIVEGPTGLLMTTTANHIHPEDESRMLSYHLEESAERTREVLVSQALHQGPPKPIDTKPWFALDSKSEVNIQDVNERSASSSPTVMRLRLAPLPSR